MDNKQFQPESLMMSHGYKPELSEGAIKCPIFQTSTFVFQTAEQGKAFFEVAYGKREKKEDEQLGLIYSRINNPNLEIAERRLCLWDKAEEAAIFESGMAAISTVFLEFLKPGDLLVYNTPLYGGTDSYIKQVLPTFGVHTLAFKYSDSKADIIAKIKNSGHADKFKLLYIETPANPTNALTDLRMCKEIATELSSSKRRVLTAIDNTYLGPLWQNPIELGIDLVLYSATKYIGGHSDLIAGACLGSAALIKRIKTLRTFLGNMGSPHTSWLIMRSLETLKIRMDQQSRNAKEIAAFLLGHEKVEKVYYLGHLTEGQEDYAIFKRQCKSPGAMISFDIKGGEKEAFAFLNKLKLVKLAVSLGSTESLAQHPATMTHSAVSEEDKRDLGITDKLIRLSVGVENHEDLISDITQALG